MRTRWGLALGAGLFAACSATLTAPEDEPVTPGIDAGTDATPADSGLDGPGRDAAPFDAGCPTCPTFEGVTALVGAGGSAYVGYKDGVARCDTKKCDRFAIQTEGPTALAIDSDAFELVVISGRRLFVCALASSVSFECVLKQPALPDEIRSNPPSHLAVGPDRIYWTSAASDTLRGLDRIANKVAVSLALARTGVPLVRGPGSILYAATPGIYEITDGSGTGTLRSDENGKYKNVRDLAFGSGTLGVIRENGSVSQCKPGGCDGTVTFEFAGPTAATDVTVGLGSVYWTSTASGDVQGMRLDTATVSRVGTVTSPTLITTTDTHVVFVSGPHGPDVYALHFTNP